MDIEALSYALEEIIQENIEQGSMFSIEKVTAIWKKAHPNIEFQKVFTKLFAEEKVSLASKSHCEYHS
ncbi:hypothetical protein [Serpens gallinarum]|uniref:Uncharacterized protein n=1 Tax=Serpens gallinarum TaxID=2763075 RepID=A0ABR8TQ44_9PSED|nr:hypothetical protein [Serpens gallinarum]MBD7977902.1 hypothetical protein [Serpens gallinarum]